MSRLIAAVPRRLACALLLAALGLTPGIALAAETVLAEGQAWDKRTAKIEGSWQIVERGDRLVLVLGAGFKTKKAPDLKAFLSKLPATGIDKKRLPQDSLRLGLLESHTGTQELVLPAGTSLDDYRTLVIHCEKYDKVWGVTALP